MIAGEVRLMFAGHHSQILLIIFMYVTLLDAMHMQMPYLALLCTYYMYMYYTSVAWQYKLVQNWELAEINIAERRLMYFVLKALFNNVFTLKNLSCMSLHAISVFEW